MNHPAVNQNIKGRTVIAQQHLPERIGAHVNGEHIGVVVSNREFTVEGGGKSQSEPALGVYFTISRADRLWDPGLFGEGCLCLLLWTHQIREREVARKTWNNNK